MIVQTSSSAKPLVSVIIPAFQAGKYIAKTLDSVIGQFYTNLEIIVVDDGSTDDTVAILRHYAALDSRIKIFQQENQGAASARNLALRHASGEFVAPIDADDIWHPENLQKQVVRLQKSGAQTAVCYAWSMDIDEMNQPIGTGHAYLIGGNAYATLLCHYFPGNGSCTIIRKQCLDKVGWYSTAFRENDLDACEDWELYLRLSTRYEFTVVPEFLVGYRKHSKAKTQTHQLIASAHEFMLSMVEKSAHIPNWVRALSCSSLYIYLAQQCAGSSASKDRIKWLQLALRTDPITPLLRLDFYKLFLTATTDASRQERKNPSVKARSTGGAVPFNQIKCHLHCFPRLLAGQALHLCLRLLSKDQNPALVSAHPESEGSGPREELQATSH